MCSCCHCWFTQSGARSPFKKQEFIEFMNHLCSDLKYHLLQSCCFFWFSWLIGNHTSAQMCQRNLMESILILQPLWIASVEHMSILKYLPQNKHNMKNMIDADWEIASGSTSDWKGEINTVQREQHIRKEDKGMKYDTYLPFVFFTSGELAIDVFLIITLHTSLKKKSDLGLHCAEQEAISAPLTFWMIIDSGYLEGGLWCDCLEKLRDILHDFSFRNWKFATWLTTLSAHHMESTLKMRISRIKSMCSSFQHQMSLTSWTPPLDDLCFMMINAESCHHIQSKVSQWLNSNRK